MASFGDLLRTVRRNAGISQRELASRVRLDFSYISKLENDRIPPPAAETIVEICKALELPPEAMLAASGKLTPGIQASVGSSPAAQSFLRNASQMGLSEEEWKELTSTLRRLRED